MHLNEYRFDVKPQPSSKCGYTFYEFVLRAKNLENAFEVLKRKVRKEKNHVLELARIGISSTMLFLHTGEVKISVHVRTSKRGQYKTVLNWVKGEVTKEELLIV